MDEKIKKLRQEMAVDALCSNDTTALQLVLATMYNFNADEFYEDVIIGYQDLCINTAAEMLKDISRKAAEQTGLYENYKETVQKIKDIHPGIIANLLPANVIIGQSMIKAGEDIMKGNG